MVWFSCTSRQGTPWNSLKNDPTANFLIFSTDSFLLKPMQFRNNCWTAVVTKLCFTQIGTEPQRFSWRLSSGQEILSISKKRVVVKCPWSRPARPDGRDPFEEEHLILFGNDEASHHLSSPQFLTVALALQPWVEYTFWQPLLRISVSEGVP